MNAYSPLGRTAAQQFFPVDGDSRSESRPPSTEHRNRHEPTEKSDPMNGLLDLFEAQVSLLLQHGAEVALRTRLARLLPPLPVAGDRVASGRLSERESEATSKSACELELVALIGDCARFEKFKMSAAAHACVGRMKASAVAALEAAKLNRPSPAAGSPAGGLPSGRPAGASQATSNETSQ